MTDAEMWRRAHAAQQILFGDQSMTLLQIQQVVAYVLIAATWDSGLMADDVVDPVADGLKRVWPLVESWPADGVVAN